MSVKDNIAYGMLTPPSEEEIKKTLEQAQAWDFIDEKPDKLLTMLTETGGGFSGGQMQRLVIARALIRKPDVMLLDEATSALDPVNERAVQDTLDKVMKGFTTVFIAHRLTTIKDADKIIVIDHGKVVEQGTHTELLNIPIKHEKKDGKDTVVSGFYHNQWDTQFNEKDMTTHQIKDKIVQLEMELANHRAKVTRINKNMRTMRVAGVLGALQARHTKFEDCKEIDNTSGENAHGLAMERYVTGEAEYHDDHHDDHH
jgi:ABC-type multidrug transport system ATPase subunit